MEAMDKHRLYYDTALWQLEEQIGRSRNLETKAAGVLAAGIALTGAAAVMLIGLEVHWFLAALAALVTLTTVWTFLCGLAVLRSPSTLGSATVRLPGDRGTGWELAYPGTDVSLGTRVTSP